MTNNYKLSFVAEGDVMEQVRRVRGKSPASLQQVAHTGRVKIVPRRRENETLTVLLSKFLVATEQMPLLRSGPKGSKTGVRETQNQETLVERLCAVEGGDQKMIHRCQKDGVVLKAVTEHGNILYVG